MLGDSLRRRHTGTEPKARKTRRPRRRGSGFPWRDWLLAALVVILVSFGAGYLLATQVLFPRPVTAGTGIPVPELVGMDRAEAEAALREEGLQIGEVREVASLQVEPERVLAQSPLPGQELRSGATVAIGVSAGPPEIRVPPVAGLGAGTASALLEGAGFEVEIQQVRSRDVPAGVVANTVPGPGSALVLPASVTLLINAGAPVDSLPDDPMDPGARDTAGAPASEGGAPDAGTASG
jgi:beta-lactam-binding protein with PASTA domain